MRIAYLKRGSEFLAPCLEAIAPQRSSLEAGKAITVMLQKGGYSASTILTVDAIAADDFESDWEGNDVSRFPARIKSLALKQAFGLLGMYRSDARSGWSRHLCVG